MDINSPVSVPLYLAMLSHPLFKINFIPDLRNTATALEYIGKCKGMMLKAIEIIDMDEEQRKISMDEAAVNTYSLDGGASSPQFFLGFVCIFLFASSHFILQLLGEDGIDVSKLLDLECSRSDIIMLEIKSFFREKLTENLEILDKYPSVEKVFLKFNCLMSSEADCERIFSYAAKISKKKSQI